MFLVSLLSWAAKSIQYFHFYLLFQVNSLRLVTSTIDVSVYLSICLSVYLSICLSIGVWFLKLSESRIREVLLTNKFRMFWNVPEHCLKRISLIQDEDEILSNPRQIQV